MTYGVKVIHTHVVGENGKKFYEELILRVEADSFDEAFEKAKTYCVKRHASLSIGIKSTSYERKALNRSIRCTYPFRITEIIFLCHLCPPVPF